MEINSQNRVIDCFMYYDERELLELRIKLLNPYVDKFLIFEGNRYFSGIPKPYMCQQILNELGIQNDKIEIVEVNLPPEEEIEPVGLDYHMRNVCDNKELKIFKIDYWVRERIQRNAFCSKINEFSNNDVFIFSNCDEIINPTHLNYLPNILRGSRHLILKLPLVRLQTRANLREYYRESNQFVPDDTNAFMCMKHHLNGSTPAQIRANGCLPFPVHYAVHNNTRIEDIGWHFTRQGKTDIPYEDNEICVQPYPENLLPQLIYRLPEVKKLLLPQHANNTLTLQEKLKDLPVVNCISLEQDYRKREELIKKFKQCNFNNIKFNISKPLSETKDVWVGDYTATNVKTEHISISINHIKSIKNWYETTNDSYGFFCEDDLSLETVQYWNFTWKQFIENLPNDWECIQLSNIRTQYVPICELKLTERQWFDWGAQAFILTREYAKKIIDTYCREDGTFNIVCPKPDTQPIPENILFVGIGNVLNLPMFVENYNIKHEHFINVVKNLWKTYQYNGCLDSITKL